MEPKDRHQECIHSLEDILSSVRMHGGVVTLTKETKVSKTSQDNPKKICMGDQRLDIFFPTIQTHKATQSLSSRRKCAM